MHSVGVVVYLVILYVVINTGKILAVDIGDLSTGSDSVQLRNINCTIYPYCILGGLYYNSTNGALCPGANIPKYIIGSECLTSIRDIIVDLAIKVDNLTTNMNDALMSYKIRNDNRVSTVNTTATLRLDTSDVILMKMYHNHLNENVNLIYYTCVLIWPTVGIIFLSVVGIILHTVISYLKYKGMNQKFSNRLVKSAKEDKGSRTK